MKFFIETANLEQLEEAADMGLVDGVSINPSLLAKEGVVGYEAMMQHYLAICQLVDCDVVAEVVANDLESMIVEAQALSALHYQIVVKLPATRNGIRAIKFLSDKGIRTCATLVFSLGQAMLAAKAGASFVSTMLSRIDDSSGNGVQLVRQIAEAFSKYGINTEILATSIRSTKLVTECIESGTPILAAPMDLLLSMLDNPLTEIGLSKYLDDFSRLN
jgi:transaldolase